MSEKIKTFDIDFVDAEDRRHDPLAIEARIAKDSSSKNYEDGLETEVLEKTYALRKERLGKDNPLTRDACSELAGELFHSGRYGKTAELYEELYETCPEDAQRERISLGLKLGMAYRYSFQPLKAMRVLRITSFRAAHFHGPTCRQNVRAIQELAGALYDMGRFQMAISWLEGLAEIGNTPSPWGDGKRLDLVIEAERRLAWIYAFRLNDREKAIGLCNDVIRIEREMNSDPITVRSIDCLARIHRHFLELDKATELFELLYAETSGSVRGSRNADDCLLDIADTFLWSRPDEAEKIYEKVYEKYKTVTSIDPVFPRAAEGLAECCSTAYPIPDHAKEAALLGEAYDWFCLETDENSPEAIRLLYRLAVALGNPESESSDENRARTLIEKAYRQSVDSLGKLHPLSVKILAEYTSSVLKDDCVRAAEIYKDACGASFKAEGEKSPTSQELVRGLALVCRRAYWDRNDGPERQGMSQSELMALTVAELIGDCGDGDGIDADLGRAVLKEAQGLL